MSPPSVAGALREVFDADAGGLRNEHIGVVEIRLDDINRAQDEDGKPTRAVHGWFRLQNRPGYPSDTAGSSGGRRRSSALKGQAFRHRSMRSSTASTAPAWRRRWTFRP